MRSISTHHPHGASSSVGNPQSTGTLLRCGQEGGAHPRPERLWEGSWADGPPRVEEKTLGESVCAPSVPGPVSGRWAWPERSHRVHRAPHTTRNASPGRAHRRCRRDSLHPQADARQDHRPRLVSGYCHLPPCQGASPAPPHPRYMWAPPPGALQGLTAALGPQNLSRLDPASSRRTLQGLSTAPDTRPTGKVVTGQGHSTTAASGGRQALGLPRLRTRSGTAGTTLAQPALTCHGGGTARPRPAPARRIPLLPGVCRDGASQPPAALLCAPGPPAGPALAPAAPPPQP